MSCGCSNCTVTVTSTQGPKGDAGATGPTGSAGVPGAIGGTTSNVIIADSANLVLTSSQTGSTVYLSRLAGVTATLPETPPVGTFFKFEPLLSVTSNSYIVQGKVGSVNTDIMVGNLITKKAATADATPVVPDGVSNYKISMNGTTTGGLIGTSFTTTYIGSNKWAVSGVTIGSGSLVTPFTS